MTRPCPFFAGSVAAALIVIAPAAALAQTREPRVTLSALSTREHVSIDAGEGTLAGTGAAITLRLTRFVSLYGELTAGSGEAFDSYEGVFATLAAPGAPLAEIERLGLVMRRDRMWKAGTGGGFGVVFHTPTSQRIGATIAVGLAGRSLELFDTRTVVRVPEGWPESRSTGAGTSQSARQHGGVTLTLGMTINITRHLMIAPEVRWLHTLADEDFAVRSFGVHAGWRF